MAQVVDFYLAEERAKERAEVVRLAGLEDDASRALLRGYVREAQRASLLPARMWSSVTFVLTPNCFPLRRHRPGAPGKIFLYITFPLRFNRTLRLVRRADVVRYDT